MLCHVMLCYVMLYIYIYIYIYMSRHGLRSAGAPLVAVSEGEMIRLETLVELKFINSSSSSLSSY